VIKLIKASMPTLKLWHITDPKLSKELLHHEDLKKREVRCYKIGTFTASHASPQLRPRLNVVRAGVLYAREGQRTEEEILGNRTFTFSLNELWCYSRAHSLRPSTEDSSDDFDRFLELLGDKVKLEGWKGYRGDLDVNQNKNGDFSVYTKLHNEIEVRYHCTRQPLPLSSAVTDETSWMLV
jgi:hypothetical protein